ncbi:MAG: dipeptidase [Tannerella sp.]|jgi:acetylornithine deacetylase/succinyl-diaminopimelate desuccinylase-like protein|nr:dipeptidase [Tannerella sp.]
MNKQINNYIETNKDRFLEDWFKLLRIPSVSSQHEHHADMQACAECWRDILLASGADKAEVMPTAGHPVVYAERIISSEAPTVLVYGHYDVMPPEPLEFWKSAPFEPEVRDGMVYARGADDDKGQALIQVKGFETALRNGLLTCNVKFIIEGEEEIGSPSLEAFCEAHREMLKADVILVSDTTMVSEETVSLTTGLRGIAYWEMEVTGPNRDLHSGHFGGAVANPLNVLCNMLSGILDEDGRITIPHFYDDVEELPRDEKEMLAQVPFDETKYRQAIDVEALSGEKGYTALERTGCRPTFDICGMWGGYMGEGSKTVLPSKAYAKVSCRLVPHQDPEKISRLFIDYITGIAPSAVKVKVTYLHGGQAYVCPIDLPAYRAAEKAFNIAFGQKPLAVRRGGSIPIIATLEKILGIKTILMGFGVESNAIHSPNEHFSLDRFYKGVKAVAKFYCQKI